MGIYTAKVRFVNVRVITIEADSFDEAKRKYDVGEWASEDTVDFYSDAELSPLKEST